MSQIKIENKAFSKIMLHCLKHIDRDCHGFLMGRKENNTIVVEDAIPAFHERFLAPQLNLCLRFIDTYYSSDLKIVGVYQNLLCNYEKEITPTTYLLQIMESLNTVTNGQIGIMISSQQYNSSSSTNVIMEQPKIRVISLNGSNIDNHPDFEPSSDQINEVKSLVKSNSQLELYDFDDHLINPSLNWINQ